MWRQVMTVLWLGVVAAADLRKKSVAVWMLAVGGILGLSTAGYDLCTGLRTASDVAGALLPGGLLIVVSAVTQKAGRADGIALLVLGCLATCRECVLVFAASLFAIAVASMVLLILRKARQNTKIPYLPFLWAGYLLQMAVSVLNRDSAVLECVKQTKGV